MSTINEKLKTLYENKWKDLTSEADKIKGIKPAHPLLIKLMIITKKPILR
jgi:hypothetical protein